MGRKDPSWFDYTCAAVTYEKGRNPVTGEECFKTSNDLGTTVYTGQRHPHCQNVNHDGKCVLWEAI